MGRNQYIRWGFEFVSYTAIAIILSQGTFSRFWIVIPIIVMLITKAFEFRFAVAERHFRVRDQLSLLMTLVPFEDVRDVRCTYHVPIWWNRFLQTCDYIHGGGGGGRKFSRKKGIIGAAFAEKKFLVENFTSDEHYRREMVSQYKYTVDDLQERKADRRSYFCYPIIDEDHRVLGLIYFDSKEEGTFKRNEENERTEVMIKACESIKAGLL